MKCAECGNTETFRRFSKVTEVCLVDGTGEFIKVIHADTDEIYDYECEICESSLIEEE